MTTRIRRARQSDVADIVRLLADDALGVAREDPTDRAPYQAAFARVDADPNQHLIVAERMAEPAGEIVGTLQLSLQPGLSRRGATRCTIEGVRIAADARGTGLGTQLLEWAVEEASRLGASLVQLTSDASRADARRFYEHLGFTASHVGFKRTLD
ncbi:MAG: GNAT family N-acetyltransferase [Humibacillus sp.]|nr:GNAT family N-acetyltransferase [Humibacillus sp.]MDN5780310.1 GNAT family N-acetyltransferase [Humibacillus sp.]